MTRCERALDPSDQQPRSTGACPSQAAWRFGRAFVLLGKTQLGPFVIEGLSAGGALLRGVFPAMCVSATLRIRLDILGCRPIWIAAQLRHRAEGTYYVAFDRIGDGTQDLIQEAVLAQLEAERLPQAPSVVVLSDSPDLQRRLREDLRPLGRNTIPFSDALDALNWMETSAATFNTILIDASFFAGGLDTLNFLADRYPDKRRVLVRGTGNGLPPSAIFAVHGVTDPPPWRRETLELAIGVSPVKRTPAKRILFVDDEVYVLSSLQCRLRKELRDCETVWAVSGKTALAEFRARAFDIVVSDLNMPGMDGMALLGAIKREAPTARRIVLTGYEVPGASEVADRVLRKPCPTDVLCEALLAA